MSNMGSFGYNWLNCKNLELKGIDYKKTLVFELKNNVNFERENDVQIYLYLQ
jgi:hypothetical protein